jgi:uncharacterized repeat protein (TIGR01451 family)
MALEVMTTQNQPFTGDDAASLLNEVAAYKNSSEALRQLGLVHLFTGKSLADLGSSDADTRVLGLANIGSVCDPQFGVALTLARNTSDAVFIAAHEISHNLGAPHDGEPGSVCAAEPTTFLMAPILNFSDEFSTCSVNQMLPEINGGACITNLPANDLAVRVVQEPDSIVAHGSSFDGEFAVENLGLSTAYGIQIEIVPAGAELIYVTPNGPGQNNCFQYPATSAYDCYNYDLEAGEQISFEFQAAGSDLGIATIEANVISLSDDNSSNDSYTFEFEVAPSVDFEFTGSTQSERTIHPNETSEVRLRFLNRGVVAATNAIAELSATLPYEIVEAFSPTGEPCTLDQNVDGRWLCQLGTVPVNQSLELPVTIRGRLEQDLPPGESIRGTVQLKLYADQPEKDYFEWSDFSVVVAPTFADLIPEFPMPAVVTAGDPVTVTVLGRNLGPDAVSDAVLTITLPKGFDFVSIGSENATCTVDDRNPSRYECLQPHLEPGAAITVDLTATFTDAVLGRLSANISGITFDPILGNNRESISITESNPAPPPVQPPSPPPTSAPSTNSGGGGGGSTGAFWLVLLALAAYARKTALQNSGPSFRKNVSAKRA